MQKIKYSFDWDDKLVEEYHISGLTMKDFKRIKRNWKIIKFSDFFSHKHFYELNLNGDYTDGQKTFTLIDALKTIGTSNDLKVCIHTVQRLSDNIIFSLGSKAVIKKQEFTIEWISVFDDGRVYLDNSKWGKSYLNSIGGYLDEIEQYTEIEL